MFVHYFRIVRNKAAEKAKTVNHHGHHDGHHVTSSSPVSPASQTASVITHGSAASVPSHLHNQHGGHAISAHDSPLQRPGSYSINGILGIPQTDPNGNIKRKREDNGERSTFIYIFSLNYIPLQKFGIIRVYLYPTHAFKVLWRK